MAKLEKFPTPDIAENPGGWGPNSVPAQFKDMPYQPFSKSDTIWKISNWTGNQFYDRRVMMKYGNLYGAGGTQYAYYHEEDESSFQLVDTAKSLRPNFGRGRFQRGRGGADRGGRGGQNQRPGAMQVLGGKNQKMDQRSKFNNRFNRGRGGNRYNNRPQIKQRESSVTVTPDFKLIEEMEKTQLSKLSLPTVQEGKDLATAGQMEYYEKQFDRINNKKTENLERVDRIFHTVTTTDDPVIRKLTKTVEDANVFATDAILATLMCANRSQYSWDIVVQKIGGKVFLDKRDNTEFDLLTVSETSAEPPQDEGTSINSPRSLALEATFINHNFSQQVINRKAGNKKYKFDEENPFADDEEEGEVASVGYRYRKWDLGNDVKLVARCEHDAVLEGPNNSTLFLNIKALNEWDPKFSGNVDWRQKLDTQRGAVLANELKNNACKLAKWTVQALLAGSDLLKFGYITRANVKDSKNHVILGTQHFKPVELAQQINLSMDNCWGIVRCIIDLVRKQDDGKFLIVKDPNKSVIRLYDIPDNTFESDEDDDDEEADE